ncbi:class I SAM-dependent methyltransferase [Candidatus Eisenbacteria bacterium]|uniref:Class I SAM-dependent methyltransferase n=1 Tax=Eiseniibacteriota bacterium TaxID=2212470 RepID=A0ABV6YHZ8_UNCEI
MNRKPAASIPPASLLDRQADWLAPARSRLLRKVAVARRRRILEVGAAFGTISHELARRGGGSVVALDSVLPATSEKPGIPDFLRVRAMAETLPFRPKVFDLVFFQMALLWMNAPRALAEAVRSLESGGALIAIEPDYGGMIEFPASVETRDVWIAGLRRAGADPRVGRKLPALLEEMRLRVTVDLIPQLIPPAPERFDLLEGLPLSENERLRLEQARAADKAHVERGESVVAHLPFFLITAFRME